MHVLILAGGGGTRLWPLSKRDFPKQFLRFNDPFSLLQKTAQRFLKASFVDSILVLTHSHYEALVREQLQRIDPNRSIEILIEPFQKNTAPAISLGVKYLEEFKGCAPEDPILVIPSDHLIEPESVFLSHLEESASVVRQGCFVLFGIRPSAPETGYGYIQIGKKVEGALYRVERFVEKPDLLRAEEYLESGDYYWNAGIFAFSCETFWSEMLEHAKGIAETMQNDFQSAMDRFDDNPSISIDFALIEKTKKALVCPLPISWSDIGCWDSVYEVMGKDKNLNVKLGNVLDIETKNSLIMANKKLISTIGLEDVLIVDTDEATFISKRGESQKVRELVAALRKKEEHSLQNQQPWGNVKQLYNDGNGGIEFYTLFAAKKMTLDLLSSEKASVVVLKGCLKWEEEKKFRGDSFEILGSRKVEIENLSDSQTQIIVVYF